ncbi:6-phosphofructokinase [Clostridiaceae bacterium JG1575]|nr:6-phosphofructokinase [Clostridiaceae bacterium JG1575]
MPKNIMIAQSGGPTAVINASLAGAIAGAKAFCEGGRIYGARHGLEGLLHRQVLDLGALPWGEDDLEALKNTPSMALGSCRFKLPEPPHEVYERMAECLSELSVDLFLYIGGNDSMDTVDKLSRYFDEKNLDIACIGIPKTIDNDLMETDHTPGYGSAARYVAHVMRELYCDVLVYDRPSVTIVEIMGRNTGWLTAASVLARTGAGTAPHLIYLPETPFDPDQFLEAVRRLSKEHQVLLIAVSEGIRFASGEYVNHATLPREDGFGHTALAGSGRYLEELVQKAFGFKTRTIELSLLQRSAAHLASSVDRREAFLCGEQAVAWGVSGRRSVMVGMKRIQESPYLIEYVPIPVGRVANREKKIPKDWIAPSGTDLTEEFIAYAAPLLGDQVLPMFLRLDPSILPDPFAPGEPRTP